MSIEPIGVELDRLTDYLLQHVPGIYHGELTLHPFDGGRSGNITIGVTSGAYEFVLRRPPLGPYDPAAYNPSRDFRFLVALANRGLPTPHPIALCTDTDVIGVPFYLMERVYGRTLNFANSAPELQDPEMALRLGISLVSGLADLHKVEPSAVGLGDVGRPDGFVERQVNRWTRQLEERCSRHLPGLVELSNRLRKTLEYGSVRTEPPRPTIVHGDYNLSNVLFAMHDFSIVAILDWEQATIGHPLVDLGVLMSHNGPWQSALLGASGGTAELRGFPTPHQIAERYEQLTRVDTRQVDFFHLLALFKILVITEDVRTRFLAGYTSGDQYATLGNQTDSISEYALTIANESGIKGLDGR